MRKARASLLLALQQPLSLLSFGGHAGHVQAAITPVGQAAITRLRTEARARSRSNWEKQTGLRASAPVGTEAIDVIRASQSAASLAGQYGEAVDDILNEEGVGIDQYALATQAFDTLGSAIERTAYTETVHAWNAEAAGLFVAAAASYPGRLVQVWSALLDGRTCPECSELDEQERVAPERFAEMPPLHPRCRCVIDSYVKSIEELEEDEAA